MLSVHLILLFSLLLRTSNCELSVIIVGAGPAGIATATRLLKNNFTNFIILEAENRIGGRVHSVEFGDAVVDLGAEWCHGEKDNIVFEMVKDLDLLGLRNIMNSRTHYSNRAHIREDISEKLFEILESIYTPDGNKHQDEGLNLGDYCIREFNKRVRSLDVNDTIHSNFVQDYIDYFQRYVLASEGAFSWFYPSAESDYRDCEGRLDWNWKGRGYGTILNVLMNKFPNISKPLPIDNKFLLEKEVEKIFWDNRNNSVTVTCADDSVFNADVIVFTPSLGVLKDRHEIMFEPILPEYKKRAISSLGIGAVLKIMLLFPYSWWPAGEDFGGFHFVWTKEHKKSSFKRFSVNGKVWIFDMMAIIPVENNQKVLSAWFAGDSVPDIEILDGKLLLQGINVALNQFLGHQYNISYPISFVRSQWYTNPHFRGTYSYQTVVSRQSKSNVDMGKSLRNRNGKDTVLFAGEVTNPYHYSTVHGAIETGFREADKIINMLKGKEN